MLVHTCARYRPEQIVSTFVQGATGDARTGMCHGSTCVQGTRRGTLVEGYRTVQRLIMRASASGSSEWERVPPMGSPFGKLWLK